MMIIRSTRIQTYNKSNLTEEFEFNYRILQTGTSGSDNISKSNSSKSLDFKWIGWNDILVGGNQNDIIIGGLGADTL